jgi:hypothetical protein
VPKTSTRTITLKGRDVTYRVRRSTRAKRPSLRADPANGITVVVPDGASVDIPGILRDKASWVLKYDDKMKRVGEEIPDRSFEDGATFPILGRERTIRVRDVPESFLDGDSLLEGDEIVLSRDRVEADGLHDALERLFRSTARALFTRRVQTFAEEMNVTFGRIQIRNQKTRWGSYSSGTGTLSLNYRLLMAPPEIVDYILIHELAHVKQPNHSSNFWDLVEKYDPDYREKEAWLDRRGHTLVFDGRHL